MELYKINQARVVEVIMESSVLFDCTVKPWNIAEINKLHRVVDEAYRYIWSKKNKGPVRIQMETEKVNMFGIRKLLGIESLRAKIGRSLQRMGHVLRMSNDRLTKKVCLGWYRREGRRTGKQTTIYYWRKLVREAGLDPDNLEMYARDRNSWKNQIKIRMEQIGEWEEQMARKHRGNEQEVENITRKRKRNSIRESLQCDWEHCGRLCKAKAGLKAHQRMAHREKIVEFDCYKCGESFSSQGVKEKS